jgi:hypothetical protein
VAATPVGLEIAAKARLVEAEGRHLRFEGEALAAREGTSEATYLAVTAGAQNVGSEKVDLDHDYCAPTVATHEVGPAADASGGDAGSTADTAPQGRPPDEARWLPLDQVFFVLQEQGTIESGSSFSNQLLIRLPGKRPASEPPRRWARTLAA